MVDTHRNTSSVLRGTGVANHEETHLDKFGTDTGTDTAMVTMETNLCEGLDKLQATPLLPLDHMCMLQDKHMILLLLS